LRNAMSQKACFASWKTCSRKATALGSRCIAGGGCSTLRLASAPRIWVRLGVSFSRRLSEPDSYEPRSLPSQSEQSCGGPMPQTRPRTGEFPSFPLSLF
jgi:hypothetical protein